MNAGPLRGATQPRPTPQLGKFLDRQPPMRRLRVIAYVAIYTASPESAVVTGPQ